MVERGCGPGTADHKSQAVRTSDIILLLPGLYLLPSHHRAGHHHISFVSLLESRVTTKLNMSNLVKALKPFASCDVSPSTSFT